MKNYFYLLFLSLFIFGCESNEADSNPIDQPTGNLELNFILNYQGEPLVMYEDLLYSDNLPAEFSKVNMYISEVSAGNHSDEEVFFVDFSDHNNNAMNAEAGLSVIVDQIPVGNYEKLAFTIGLPQDVNATMPIDYAADHPLAKVSEYWPGWDSYIFAKYEGRVQLETDSTLSTGFVVHTGSDAMYRNLPFEVDFTVTENQTTTAKVYIDAYRLFAGDGQEGNYIDLKTVQGVHNQEDLNIMEVISDNYSRAITLTME